MSVYKQILYQIIFGTKNHEKTMISENQERLYSYIAGVMKRNKCFVYRINGIEDHLHIISDLHPSCALSNVIKDIKLATSDFIKREKLFPNFRGWQEGYGAFTYSINDKDRLIAYVGNQKEHHRVKTFREEFIELLHEHGIVFDERYLL